MLNARQILFRHKLSTAEFRQRLLGALELDAGASQPGAALSSRPARRSGLRKWWPAALAAMLLIAALVVYFLPSLQEPQIDFSERDWVLVTNLANRTEDPGLGEALENSLRIALEQSKYASILPVASIRAAKQRMDLDPDAPLDRESAIELAQREDAKVSIVGDIAHSRVARSNMWSLTALGAEVVLCGPPTLLPAGLNGIVPNVVENDLPPVHVEHNLDLAIEDADVVMALRLQRERQSSGLLPSLREYSRLYQVHSERLARAKPDALVMHPGPINEGVEISSEVAHGARSLVEEQVTNGVAIRMAVLYLLMRGEPPQ